MSEAQTQKPSAETKIPTDLDQIIKTLRADMEQVKTEMSGMSQRTANAELIRLAAETDLAVAKQELAEAKKREEDQKNMTYLQRLKANWKQALAGVGVGVVIGVVGANAYNKAAAELEAEEGQASM